MIQAIAFLVVLIGLALPLGRYLERVFTGRVTALRRVERLALRILRVDADAEQDWRAYARSLLTFSILCTIALYVTLRPQMPWDLAFNSSISFVSNTSWQFYAGETTLTNLTQAAGIGAHSFLSAAVGLASGIAVIRGFANRSVATLGNFWVDLVRGLLYVLLPIAILSSLLLIWQGTPQTLASAVHATTPAGAEQTATVGPIASQVAIKTMGSVGGGFLNVNSAAPFENPTGLASFLQSLLIVLVPAALPFMFGRMVGNFRQGVALFAAMLALAVPGYLAIAAAEERATPAQEAAALAGPNLEGKEQRFGIDGTALYAESTTAGSSGAVNGAMESMSGGTQAVVMSNMLTGELVFGGIGTGLSSLLMVALIAVFLAGLMVGRTPEWQGKKVGLREVKLALLATLAAPVIVLACTALAVATKWGLVSPSTAGAQGFSEAFYAYTSQTMNNGSALAGYAAVSFSELLGGVAMLLGRYAPIMAALAVAGSLAGRRPSPPGLGTPRTDRSVFVLMQIGVIVAVVLLSFLPALLVGPLGTELDGAVGP